MEVGCVGVGYGEIVALMLPGRQDVGFLIGMVGVGCGC